MRTVLMVLVGLVVAVAARGAEPVRTPETGARVLQGPVEAERMTFAVFGDIAPGGGAGLGVVARAVETANHLGVRFVVTTGNMFDGQTTPARWADRAGAFKRVIGGLQAPWYPVAGPLDTGASPASREEARSLYRAQFGPMVYAFDTGWAHLVVLSSELLGERGATRDGVVSWLRDDLRATRAEQIFVFVHAPLWLSEDKEVWEGVHRVLAQDGRPARVISGGTRYARDDGQRDNVRYGSVSMTGAFAAETHGYASSHAVTLVSVTRTGHEITVLPHDATEPGQVFLGADADAVGALARSGWVAVEGFVQAGPEAGDGAGFEVVLENPTPSRFDFDLEIGAPEGWMLSRQRVGGTILPGQTLRLPVAAEAPALTNERPRVEAVVTARYPVEAGGEQTVIRRGGVPVRPRGAEEVSGATPAHNGVLDLNGRGAVRVELGERPWRLTAEAWVRGPAPGGSSAVMSRGAEGSGFAIIWSRPGGVLPAGLVGTDRGLARAGLGEPIEWGAWHHVALTYDGKRAVLFVDGREAGRSEEAGELVHADLPLYIGAEPNARGDAMSWFAGQIDEVRVSSSVRYTGPFEPARVLGTDEQTLLLLHFDTPYHGAFPDDSGRGNHGWAVGSPRIVPADR